MMQVHSHQEHPWFAVQVRVRYEKQVASMAEQKGYDCFLPLESVRRRWSDRFQTVRLPLFPGYVFCRLDVAQRLPLLTIPGVTQVVGVGKIPIPVDDREMASLQTVAASGLELQPWPFLACGDRVHIEEGPLSGVEGILVEIKGSQQLVASITLLQRSVAVCLRREWVRPLSGSPVRGPLAANNYEPNLRIY